MATGVSHGSFDAASSALPVSDAQAGHVLLALLSTGRDRLPFTCSLAALSAISFSASAPPPTSSHHTLPRNGALRRKNDEAAALITAILK